LLTVGGFGVGGSIGTLTAPSILAALGMSGSGAAAASTAAMIATGGVVVLVSAVVGVAAAAVSTIGAKGRMLERLNKVLAGPAGQEASDRVWDQAKKMAGAITATVTEALQAQLKEFEALVEKRLKRVEDDAKLDPDGLAKRIEERRLDREDIEAAIEKLVALKAR
jgi:hypothetical protein